MKLTSLKTCTDLFGLDQDSWLTFSMLVWALAELCPTAKIKHDMMMKSLKILRTTLKYAQVFLQLKIQFIQN